VSTIVCYSPVIFDIFLKIIDWNCAKKHGLKQCIATRVFECDGCDQDIQFRSKMYCCRICDYDICIACFKPNIQDDSDNYSSSMPSLLNHYSDSSYNDGFTNNNNQIPNNNNNNNEHYSYQSGKFSQQTSQDPITEKRILCLRNVTKSPEIELPPMPDGFWERKFPGQRSNIRTKLVAFCLKDTPKKTGQLLLMIYTINMDIFQLIKLN